MTDAAPPVTAPTTDSTHPARPVPAASPAAPFGLRLATGLGGVLVAAMMSGLNDRIGSLTMVDMAGARGLSYDEGHLFDTAYGMAEIAAMPFAAWFASTFSLRRFHMAITGIFMLCALLLPLAPNYAWLVALRAVQGFSGGCMIPVLMSAALRFLPAQIKLQGLGFYSLTATFSPNIALWLAGAWTDGLNDWRFTFWQSIPIGLFVLWAIWWGIPQDPIRSERLREMDVPALVTGPPGLALLVFALEEGERMDWFHSPVIAGCLLSGLALTAIFLVSEWVHPAPFIRLQLLERRNYGLGFPVFMGLLIIVIGAGVLPVLQLSEVQRFRPVQTAPVGLIICLPQILLAPLASWLLYRRWVDTRYVAALGMLLMAIACWFGSFVTSEWMVAQFWTVQLLQMVGQPLAVVSFLYLAVAVITPAEAPYLSGLINTLKTVAQIGGAVIVERLMVVRGAAHLQMMTDRAGQLGAITATSGSDLPQRFEPQALTLAVADCYRYAGLFALVLAPLFLLFTYVAAPPQPKKSKD